MLVNQKSLSDIFGVSDRTIRDWDKAGCPSTINGKIKQYDTKEVIEWKINKEVESRIDDLDTSSLDTKDEDVREAQKRQIIAKAEKIEAEAEMQLIELAKRRGDVVVREQIEQVINDVIAQFIQALDRVPYRYPNILQSCSTINEIKEELRNMVNEIKMTINKIDIDKLDEE